MLFSYIRCLLKIGLEVEDKDRIEGKTRINKTLSSMRTMTR